METSQRIAVVEIGSRAIRLLVADILPVVSGTSVAKHSFRLEPVATGWKEKALGKALDVGGARVTQAISEIADVVRTFDAEADALNAKRTVVFGTAAVRRLDQTQLARLGASVRNLRVLSRAEEAELSFLAGVMGLRDKITAGNPVLVIDQGSGSMEVVVGNVTDRAVEVLEYRSYKLGTQELVNALAERRGDIAALRTDLAARVDGYERLSFVAVGDPILLGSAATKLAWVSRKGADPRDHYSPGEVHGKVISLTMIDKVIDLARSKPEALRQVIDPRRPHGGEFENVIAGLLAISTFLRRERKRQMIVSGHGTRFGLVWKLAFDMMIERVN